MNGSEFLAREAGYVRSPNGNGLRWYAAGPGIPELVHPMELEIRADGDPPYVVTCAVYGKPLERVDVLKFATMAEFLEWCKRHGRTSEPGMPAFMYGD